MLFVSNLSISLFSLANVRADCFEQEPFVFGDQAPTETAWRRSSEYPFSLITAWMLNQPTKIIGAGFDRARIKRNLAKELIYTETNKRLRLADIVFPNTIEDETRVQTAGLVNYNAEFTLNKDGSSNTAHTKNPVPCFLLGTEYKQINNGILADIAPTILHLMGLKPAKEMTGKTLIK